MDYVQVCLFLFFLSGEQLNRTFDTVITVNPLTRDFHLQSDVPEWPWGLHYDLKFNRTSHKGEKTNLHHEIFSSVLTTSQDTPHSLIFEVCWPFFFNLPSVTFNGQM
jgi:hypothetical protein